VCVERCTVLSVVTHRHWGRIGREIMVTRVTCECDNFCSAVEVVVNVNVNAHVPAPASRSPRPSRLPYLLPTHLPTPFSFPFPSFPSLRHGMGVQFGSFDSICQTAALVICPLLGSDQGIEPTCYSRNVDIAGTLIFQPCEFFLHFCKSGVPRSCQTELCLN